MSFFDSPVGRCEVVREMVLLDETQHECAREHGCGAGTRCPLKAYFTTRSGVSDPASLPTKRRPRQPKVRTPDASPPLEARPAKPSKPLVVAQEAPLPERKVA